MHNEAIADFFRDTPVRIPMNELLRIPQGEAYFRIHQHFSTRNNPCYVQIPVGCGKTGLMGIVPFGLSQGRVLVVVPNLTIRSNFLRELDVSSPDCFYAKRRIFVPTEGPYITELKTGANIHDCDNAHFVVANIQQFSGKANKWYEQLPRDYFWLILVDEGHHNVADTWDRLFKYFDNAKVVSFTATPLRSDGQEIMGERVYAFSYTRSMLLCYISPIDAVFVRPETVTFTAEGQTHTLSLQDVLEMRERDWFSRGIALSERCNRHIVEASLRQLHEVRKHGTPRQIIAAACSIRHARQVAAIYEEHGKRVEVLHSELSKEDRARVEAALRAGIIDVVVQVQILGEGYDLGALSVAAIFRPYRSLSPYIQFVGRILRLAIPDFPDSPGNRVYLVSHVGLNDERWWSDFQNFDTQDQMFFADFFAEPDEESIESGERYPRMTLRPFMRVLNETVETYVQKGFLTAVDETMVHDLLETIRSKGFDPTEFGLTEDVVRLRLEMAAEGSREVQAYKPLIQPQRRKEALQRQVYKEARSISDVVLNRLNLDHRGRNLLGFFPGRGDNNTAVLIALVLGRQNSIMGIAAGERTDADIAQWEAALKATPDICDALTASIRIKMEKENASS